MPKYDYTNSTIDRSDKKRLHFYEELFTILEITESVNEEVNELIGWMGVVLGYYTRIPESKEKDSVDYLKPDKKINDYTYIRNVSNQDIRLYSIISSIKECSAYNNNDSLSEITEKLLCSVPNFFIFISRTTLWMHCSGGRKEIIPFFIVAFQRRTVIFPAVSVE